MRNNTFKPYTLDQLYLLPESMLDWLPNNHEVFFLIDLVNELDITSVLKTYQRSNGGRPAYHPRMMITLLMYGYLQGIRSSRKLERATEEIVPFRVLTGNQQPDHATIATFRTRHLKFLKELFAQSVDLSVKAGIVDLKHVSVDGSKVRANASRGKAMSYANMCTRKTELEAEIDKYFEEAQKEDEEEDQKYGSGVRGGQLSEEMSRREFRLAKIREAMKALEEEAEESASKKDKAREESDEKLRAEGKKPRAKKKISSRPEDRAQRNFTDPEARIMKNGSTKSFEYAYNAQIAVDSKSQIIVATDVGQAANDVGELRRTVNQIEENIGGASPEKMSLDTGYYSDENVAFLEEKNIDGYIATKRDKHNKREEAKPRGRVPNGLSVKQKMARKLRTAKGKITYARRKAIVEPVFGMIKGRFDFRQFSLRGLEKVGGERALISAVHNFAKIMRRRAEFEPRGIRT